MRYVKEKVHTYIAEIFPGQTESIYNASEFRGLKRGQAEVAMAV